MPYTVNRSWRWLPRLWQGVLVLFLIPVSVSWAQPALWWICIWWWRRQLQSTWYVFLFSLTLVQTATLRQESWVWWLLLGLIWEIGQSLLEWLPFLGWKRFWTLAWGMIWSSAILWQWGMQEEQQAWLWILFWGLLWLLWQGKGWVRNGWK